VPMAPMPHAAVRETVPLFTALKLRSLLERPNTSSERILREREMRFEPDPVYVRSSGRSSHLPARGHSYSWPLRSGFCRPGPVHVAVRWRRARYRLLRGIKPRTARPASHAAAELGCGPSRGQLVRFRVMRRLPRSFVVSL